MPCAAVQGIVPAGTAGSEPIQLSDPDEMRSGKEGHGHPELSRKRPGRFQQLELI